MPKIFIYATAKVIWTFLFWATDSNENRAHVHVGKSGTANLCKIWIEPKVDVADKGDLTEKQVKEVLGIASQYQGLLLEQWRKFKAGEKVKMIKVKE